MLSISIIVGASLIGGITNPSENGINIDHAYFYENSSYHQVSYFFDATGNPLTHLSVSFVVLNQTNRVFSAETTTSTNGFANFTFSPPILTEQFIAYENYSYAGEEFSTNVILNASNHSMNYMSGLGYQINPVAKPRDPYGDNLLIFYLGENGTRSSTVKVYLAKASGLTGVETNGSNSYNKYNSKKLVATISDFCLTIVNVPVGPSGISQFFNVFIYSANNTLLAESVNLRLSFPSPGYQAADEAAIFSSAYLPVLGSMIAFLIAYTNYGRLFSAGVMDSILVRPITRGRLFLSRWISSAISLFTFPLLIFATLDMLIFWRFSSLIPLPVYTILLTGIYFSFLAFLGIVLALSNVVKSDSVLFGSTLFILIVFTVLWGSIGQLIGGFLGISPPIGVGVPGVSENYLSLQLLTYYLNPVGGITLASTAVTGNFENFIQPISASPYSPTAIRIVLEGVAWTVFTLAVSYFTAIKTRR